MLAAGYKVPYCPPGPLPGGRLFDCESNDRSYTMSRVIGLGSPADSLTHLSVTAEGGMLDSEI